MEAAALRGAEGGLDHELAVEGDGQLAGGQRAVIDLPLGPGEEIGEAVLVHGPSVLISRGRYRPRAVRILVTGGTGFIGSFATVALTEAGHDVRLLARDPAKVGRGLRPRTGSVRPRS